MYENLFQGLLGFLSNLSRIVLIKVALCSATHRIARFGLWRCQPMSITSWPLNYEPARGNPVSGDGCGRAWASVLLCSAVQSVIYTNSCGGTGCCEGKRCGEMRTCGVREQLGSKWKAGWCTTAKFLGSIKVTRK